MDTYSYNMTPPEVIADRLPHKYRMELNRSDMTALIAALGESEDETAQSLRVSILTTLDIEEI